MQQLQRGNPQMQSHLASTYGSIGDLVKDITSRLVSKDPSFTKLQIDDFHYPFVDLEEKDCWDSETIAKIFLLAAQSPFVTSLEIRFLEFDEQISEAFQELLLSSASDQHPESGRLWHSISLTACSGLSQDDYDTLASVATDSCKQLSWTKNKSTSRGLAALGLALTHANMTNEENEGLRSLSIQRENLRGSNANLLLNGLTSNQMVKKLDLTFCSFDDEGVESLSEILAQNTRLEELDLGASYLTDAHVEKLLHALRGHPRLRTLVLTLNACHALGSQALGQWLGDPSCSLRTLNLSHQKSNHHRVHIHPIARALVRNTSLRSLILSRNGLSNHDFSRLLCALESNRSLKELDMSGNHISDMGSLAVTLSKLSGLRKLCLGNNAIPDEASEVLVQAIQRSRSGPTSLKVLEIRDSFPKLKEIRYEMALNAAGRHLLQLYDSRHKPVPLSLWPLVIEKAAKSCRQGQHGPFEHRQKKCEADRPDFTLDGLQAILKGPALLAQR